MYFVRLFLTPKMIALPRQARDKHRASTQQRNGTDRFCVLFMHEGIPHNSYYPGDGATMTKNGGKGGAKLNPAAFI